MDSKKHHGNPHLTGEHRWGDAGQLVLLLVFLAVWISDSWVFHYSDGISEQVPIWARLGAFLLAGLTGWRLARKGLKAVFGTVREKPEVIDKGVFARLRHPIYTGAILFYLALFFLTFSLASALVLVVIILFYVYIIKHEEKLLIQQFGNDYLKYKKKTGMLFPRLSSRF